MQTDTALAAPAALSLPVATTGWDALAADGSVVHLRPVRPDDEDALSQLHRRASDRSIYLRYFAVNRAAADRQSQHLVQAQPADRHIVLVAEEGGRLVGVGSLEPMGDGQAEVAFLVDDAQHGRGLGTLLLEQLAALARERGIHHLRADTLVENGPMLRVFAASGFEQVRTIDSGVVELSLSTTYTPGTPDPIAQRERAAEERSLAPVFAPGAVAVVGAGRWSGGIGHEVLVNLVAGGFTGRLFAVNPNSNPGDQIAGVPAYPSVSDIPEPVGLVVVAVPAADVVGVVDECGLAGVRGAVILSSGFGEAGTEGRALQRELVRRPRAHGMRLIGPNCLGMANTAPDVRLDATFADIHPAPGTLAIAAQSGAIGIAVLDHASRVGPGISEFVSLGNKADVSGNDLLLHWWGDPRTEVIGLYLESFGNPRKFGRLARLVGRTKPVLVVKGGRSGGGRRAGASHTAAAATPDTAVDALFAQAGVLRMETLEELIDTARVLAGHPLPRGRRVAIVGNAGGAGVLAADAAEALGLQVPELTGATRQAMLDATGAVAAGNPTDLGAAATGQRLARAVRVLLDSGEADAIVVVFAATRAGDVGEVYAAIGHAATGATIPILINCLGAPSAEPELAVPDGPKLPVFAFPETAVRALSRAVEYAEWRERPQGVVPVLDGVDRHAVRAIVDGYLADHADGGWPPAATAAHLLAAAGITVQPMAPEGVELVAGLNRDELFGPVLMTGAGGTLTDILADRRWRGLPLTDLDASQMLRSLRCAPLLAGYRGQPAADENAVLDVLHRLARLAEIAPEIAELDVNPLVAAPGGAFAIDVKVRLAPARPVPDAYDRRLR